MFSLIRNFIQICRKKNFLSKNPMIESHKVSKATSSIKSVHQTNKKLKDNI